VRKWTELALAALWGVQAHIAEVESRLTVRLADIRTELTTRLAETKADLLKWLAGAIGLQTLAIIAAIFGGVRNIARLAR
jgi:hypothetical protein